MLACGAVRSVDRFVHFEKEQIGTHAGAAVVIDGGNDIARQVPAGGEIRKKRRALLVLQRSSLVMKTLLILVVLAIASLQIRAQGLVLNQGQSASFYFNQLGLLETNTNTFSLLRSGLGFVAPGMSSGESIQMEFYADSGLSGAPFLTRSITVPSGGIFYGAVGFETNSTLWDDLDGGVRVTMLTGSTEIMDVFFDVNRPGERYFGVQTVPEPGNFALSALGVSVWFAFLLFKSNAANKTAN
jgi:hypothetical protein